MRILFRRAPFAVKLAYDDGVPETGIAAPLGWCQAVKFSLPSGWSSARLLAAGYYIMYDLTNFTSREVMEPRSY